MASSITALAIQKKIHFRFCLDANGARHAKSFQEGAKSPHKPAAPRERPVLSPTLVDRDISGSSLNRIDPREELRSIGTCECQSPENQNQQVNATDRLPTHKTPRSATISSDVAAVRRSRLVQLALRKKLSPRCRPWISRALVSGNQPLVQPSSS